MSSKLLGLIREIRCGPRLASHKVALSALADDGKAVGEVNLSLGELMLAAECGERQALRLRTAWQRMGLLTLEHEGGFGPHDMNRYRVNIAMLEQLACGAASYPQLWQMYGGEATKPIVVKGDAQVTLQQMQPTIDVASSNATAARSKPATFKGDTKGDFKGDLGRASSSLRYNISIDDDAASGARSLPEWAIREVEEIEPQRWHVLCEAYLRWDGSAKAVDIGKAFVAW